MFSAVKRFFENFDKKSKDLKDDTVIRFSDLKGQRLALQLQKNGNDTTLNLIELKSNFELAFDKEQCTILGALFHEYGSTGKLENIAQILEKEMTEGEE